MAAIRSRDTTPELLVRRAVHGAGFRYSLNSPLLPGKPDLVFKRYRIAVFVHGCFWHGHECEVAARPRTNTTYWIPKIQRTMRRDWLNAMRLRRGGWRVVIIQECKLESGVRRLRRILEAARR